MKFILVTAAFLSLAVSAADSLPDPTPQQLPKWKGFNLLERFYYRTNPTPFQETDFQMISELGFNFVRLPMDYRFWIKDGNWEEIDDEQLKAIDQALEYGKRYNIHVCMNFHRAPGYTVAKPAEKLDLWTNPEAQRVCAKHWAHFARRYKGVPNRNLSFNLFNEPGDIKGPVYANVVKIMCDAIRAEDPDRLIICDGLYWGGKPCLELLPLNVAQATRGYSPMQISHYKASWISNSNNYPPPVWPRHIVSAWFAGPAKPDLSTPLDITLNLEQDARFRIRIGVVSQHITLKLEADGTSLWTRTFVSGPGEGEWQKSVFKKEWNVYQNIFDLDCFVDLPKGTKAIRLTATNGDWATVRELGLAVGDQPEACVTVDSVYARKNIPVTFADGQWKSQEIGRQWHCDTYIRPWQNAQKQGTGVIVGECGCFNKTPHDVALRWFEDLLRNWDEAGWGWALWNFRGSFGILDSDREDVVYEDFHGHKLDRKLCDLLLKYK